MKNPQVDHGAPLPLGATSQQEGINFALFSQHATQVTLSLFALGGKKPFLTLPLNPEINRTGWTWHVYVKGLPDQFEYAYTVDGDRANPLNHFVPNLLLSDPYAKQLNTPQKWNDRGFWKQESPPHGVFIEELPFDWERVPAPHHPPEELIIYEMHVRAFTQHPTSGVKHPGTFLGIIEKIPYLKQLGINAIELLPVFEFNECENPLKNPQSDEQLVNMWGYSTINYFSLMRRYGAVNDFKQMVKELHRAGIEVILDVVYNHTAEGFAKGPCYSFRGIDNQNYYILSPDGEYRNYAGTGNTFNGNNPAGFTLILDSLRYWVTEMHIDGFRFDLASCLTRDPQGVPLLFPPLIHLISNDPILSHVKLIAEAWDAAGLYQVGSFPGEGRWAEWNGKYRDYIRKFLKGTDSHAGHFASSLCGSQDLYGNTHKPYLSVNFVTAHDGYTLRDLVSYQDKHNEVNGENNQDGANDNESWNCGEEGETQDPAIIQLRNQQMRNFLAALLLSIGTPMLLMGDEYGHTRHGNNNPYCQDNELNWMIWDELEKEEGLVRFHRHMIQFRKSHQIFKRTSFLKPADVDWHGYVPFEPDWEPTHRFVAYTLKDPEQHQDLYIAFNANFVKADITLPPPPKGKQWHRVIDTSLPSPQDFDENYKKSPALASPTYQLSQHAMLLAKAL